MNPQDVVDTANSQTLSEQGELNLRSWARSCTARMKSALLRSLVRDEPRSNSDSECAATVGNCGDVGHTPHVANSPLGWRCEIIHAVNDFRFQWVPLHSDSGVGDVEVPAEKEAPRLGDT